MFANVPSSTTTYVAEGWPLSSFSHRAGVAASKSEAARLIRGGGIYVNDRRITDEKERLSSGRGDRGAALRGSKGKKDNYLVRSIVASSG